MSRVNRYIAELQAKIAAVEADTERQRLSRARASLEFSAIYQRRQLAQSLAKRGHKGLWRLRWVHDAHRKLADNRVALEAAGRRLP